MIVQIKISVHPDFVVAATVFASYEPEANEYDLFHILNSSQFLQSLIYNIFLLMKEIKFVNGFRLIHKPRTFISRLLAGTTVAIFKMICLTHEMCKYYYTQKSALWRSSNQL